ncbi:MAG: hypothetical protein L6435_01085, partial [Anaerolineae bacterium]|nr:hypothetical protein [Anaerolineae bacterium]
AGRAISRLGARPRRHCGQAGGAPDARRRVNGLMSERVSHLLLAGEPRLTYTDRWYWRVPVDLTFPSRGRVGSVGEVDVDATLGEVMVSEELLVLMIQRADRLARVVLETPVVESIAKNG